MEGENNDIFVIFAAIAFFFGKKFEITHIWLEQFSI
jgi:hypothetical protein